MNDHELRNIVCAILAGAALVAFWLVWLRGHP